MRIIFMCPACETALDIKFSIKVRTLARLSGNRIKEIKKIEEVKISDIRILTTEESTILRRIKPYIKPNIRTSMLTSLLIKKFNVRKSKVRHMVSIIKKAYGVGVKDSLIF